MLRSLDYIEKRRLRRVLYAKPMILLLVIVAGFAVRGAWGMYEKYADAAEKRDKAVDELAKLEIRERELESDIARLSSEDGIEAEIRERYMVAKEGEKVIVIMEPPKEGEEIIVASEEPSWWDRTIAAVGLTKE